MASSTSGDADVQAVRDVAIRWTQAVESADVTEFRSRTFTVLTRMTSGNWVVARAIGVVQQ